MSYRIKEIEQKEAAKTEKIISDFDALQIKLASPQEMLDWSFGEVTKAETINYRTQKSEKEGLFSEQIFGPVKDYECACGKYKGMRYKGVKCDRCGVEIIHSLSRRERMGHIELAAPVTHIWFLRSVPSRIGLILDIPQNALESVVYYNGYIVGQVDEDAKKKVLLQLEKEYQSKIEKIEKESGEENKKQTKKKEAKIKSKGLSESQRQAIKALSETKEKLINELLMIKPKAVFSEVDYLVLSKKYGHIFTASTGAAPVKKLLEELNLEELQKELLQTLEKQKRRGQIETKLINRYRLVRAFLKSKIKPEWMILTVLPVLPPDLRPMVQLEGGKFASYDLNDLYRRVINRNNRLKKLIELKAPEVIVKNEKRMLQEAVDALLDNSIRKVSSSTPMHAAQHRPLRSLADLLSGKQGRFRQHLLGKRVDYSGRSVIVVGPELKIDECGVPKKMALEIFKPFVINELIKREIVHSPKMANRLIEEGPDIVWEILENVVKDRLVLLNRAPTLHRLSIEAFKPKLVEGLALRIPALVCLPFNADFDGDQMALHLPLTEEAQFEAKSRMLSSLGILKPADGEPVMFPRLDMVLGIYWLTMDLPMPEEKQIKMFADEKEALLAYDFKKISLHDKIKVRINKLDGETIETTVGRIIFNEVLPKEIGFINNQLNSKDLKNLTREIVERVKDFKESAEILNKMKELGFLYATLSGISWSYSDLKIPGEKYTIIKEAQKRVEEINKQYDEGLLSEDEKKVLIQSEWQRATNLIADLVPKNLKPDDSVFVMINSGARASWMIASQIMGMKGLVVNPKGELIEMPILSSHQEGFNVLEYFAASHAGRKGLADTALKTSFAGYLTRRLVDVSHEIIINSDDCGTKKGLLIRRKEVENEGESFEDKIYGRYVLEDVKDKKGNVILKANNLLDYELAKKIAKSEVEEITVRSPLHCLNRYGLCQKCYGLDLGWKKPIELGEAVGVVAAQAIGEPGTQLTLKTFHLGGVARAVDITQGLPRVEELLEARVPKGEAPLSEVDGEVIEVEHLNHQYFIRIKPEKSENNLKSGRGRKKNKKEIIEYVIPEITSLYVKKGDKIKKGTQLCEGNLDLKKILNLLGEEACQKYILKEVKKVYNISGSKINDKHFEIIIRQMFSRVKITESGDSDFIIGEIVSKNQYLNEIDRLRASKKEPPKAIQVIKGIKAVALTSESFLSAASFQETSRVLIQAAIEGKIDYLRGLKENVIIGRLIPAGTGFKK
ncbi:MAG TPA: DNA-directed RNA polymerase subunit beta' [Candidatus Paceibacterota bacterium]|nr:DNA-directed RNA polymerase subunit beta' [Candidatus Paceibacterota bacterium]